MSIINVEKFNQRKKYDFFKYDFYKMNELILKMIKLLRKIFYNFFFLYIFRKNE